MRRPALILGTLVFAGVLAGAATPARAGWSFSFGAAWRSGCLGPRWPRSRLTRPHYRVAHRSPRIRYVPRRSYRVVRSYRPVRYRVVVPRRVVRRVVYRR